MAQTLIPTSASDLATEQQWSDTRQRRSGIINDSAGTSLRVTADGSSTTVSVSAGQAELFGLLYENSATVTVALGSLGTQPTAGQERYSRIVVRLNKAASPWSASITAITGTPAAAGSAQTPALGANDFQLATVLQKGTAAIPSGDVFTQREWVSRDLTRENIAGGDGSLYIGDLLHQSDTGVLSRRALVGGVPTTEVIHSPRQPLRKWSWGGNTYEYFFSSSAFSTPTGANRSYPVHGGHAYDFRSQFSVQTSELCYVRVSLWVAGQLVEEMPDIRLTPQAGQVSVFAQTQWLASTFSNSVEFTTRVATDKVPVIRTAFASPRSWVVDLGHQG